MLSLIVEHEIDVEEYESTEQALRVRLLNVALRNTLWARSTIHRTGVKQFTFKGWTKFYSTFINVMSHNVYKRFKRDQHLHF